jgi:hypothetical protein
MQSWRGVTEKEAREKRRGEAEAENEELKRKGKGRSAMGDQPDAVSRP